MPTWYTKTQADGLLAGKTPNLTVLPASTTNIAPTVGATRRRSRAARR
jgi:hypothetical protein